jgi:hypothetical protein
VRKREALSFSFVLELKRLGAEFLSATQKLALLLQGVKRFFACVGIRHVQVDQTVAAGYCFRRCREHSVDRSSLGTARSLPRARDG